MKKKKIAVLHAQIPFASGGAEQMVQNLTKQLCMRDYQAELVSIPYKWYPENTLYDSMLMWRMADLTEVDGEKIDLVISTKFPTYGVQHSNKVCWLMHQFREAYDLFESQYGLRFFQNGAQMQQRVVAFDQKFLPEHQDIYTISNNVTHRLQKYNHIKGTTLYHPPSLAGRYESHDYENYILSVGRVEPLKRNELLIQALPFCDEGLRAKIAGRGTQVEPLKKLAETLKVSHRVDFLGFVSDEELIALYANARGVFFAPNDEDYGYITLEAFLSKRPVITSFDAGGVLEFVENEKNGFVCKTLEPEEFGDKLQSLNQNKTLCATMGAAGYQLVKDISWDTVINALTQTLR